MINGRSKKFISGLFFLRSHPRWWMLYDALILVLALKLISFYYPIYSLSQFYLVEYALFPVFFAVSGNIFGLYEKWVFNRFVKLFLSLFLSAVLALIGLVLLRNIFLYEQIGRYTLFFIFMVIIVGCGLVRFVLGVYIRHFATKILFIGGKNKALDFKSYFTSKIKSYVFVGYCNEELDGHELNAGLIDDIDKICEERQVDIVVVDGAYIVKQSTFDKCIQLLSLHCKIMDRENFIEQVFEQIEVDALDPAWFYRANIGVVDNLQVTLKRSLDIVFAVIGLSFTALIYPIIYLAIKLDSKGHVIYSQIRCGLFGRQFKIYKFRTMYASAESNGPVWAKQKDERVTMVGGILRKTRLDEFPQFWNVLIGDMSLVGPRPERPELITEIEKQLPYFYFRHLVKPGVTGFAQIRHGYGSSIGDAREKLKHDLYYVKNLSFLQDVQIIFSTFAKIMKGAR